MMPVNGNNHCQWSSHSSRQYREKTKWKKERKKCYWPHVPTRTASVKIQRKSRSRTIATNFQSSFTCIKKQQNRRSEKKFFQEQEKKMNERKPNGNRKKRRSGKSEKRERGEKKQKNQISWNDTLWVNNSLSGEQGKEEEKCCCNKRVVTFLSLLSYSLAFSLSQLFHFRSSFSFSSVIDFSLQWNYQLQ